MMMMAANISFRKSEMDNMALLNHVLVFQEYLLLLLSSLCELFEEARELLSRRATLGDW